MVKRLISLLAAFAATFVLVAAAPVASAQITQSQINNDLCAGANGELTDPNVPCTDSQSDSGIDRFVRHFVNLLTAVVGIVAVIMIIVGGFRYVTSGGNDTSVTSAKNTILYAIIGLIIVAFAQVLVHFTLRNIANS